MENSASRSRSEPERTLVNQPDPSGRDLPHQNPRELDGGQLPPLATSSKNGDEAPREGGGDQCDQLLQERVAQVRKAAATGLVGAAQTDVLLVLRTIGLASAARAPPTEAQLGLASSLLDELARELAREARGKRSYAEHRAAARKRRDSWRRRLTDVKAPEHEWATQDTCMICFTDDPLLAPNADLNMICAKQAKEAELELSKVKDAALATVEAAAARPACHEAALECKLLSMEAEAAQAAWEAAEARGPGDCAWVLPCGHAYHQRCATKWLLHHKGECPVCKSAVPTFPLDGRRGRGFKRSSMATEASGSGPDTSQDGLLAMELQTAGQSFEPMSDEELVEETLEAACARHEEENRLDDLARVRRAKAEQTRAEKEALGAEFDAAVELVRMQVAVELADPRRVWLLAGVYGKVPSVAACIDDVGAVNEAAGVLARARQPCMPYASGELLHSLGTEVQPESGRVNRARRLNRSIEAAAVAPQADGLLARLIESGLPATVRWLVISQKECDAEDAKAGGGVWKATRRMVETAVRERLVAERATTGRVN